MMSATRLTKRAIKSSQRKIMFIGGGNMARSMITGMLHKGFKATDLYVVDRHQAKRDYFKDLGIYASDKISDFLSVADILILAIKPQGAITTCRLVGEGLSITKNKSPLIISLMAGITTNRLNEWIGKSLTIVRSVPNTPATIQLGVTGLFAETTRITEEQRVDVENIMGAIGRFAWLEREEQMNAITALSGSGPAYYFYFMEQMAKAAIDLGVPSEIARSFAIETAFGASSLARESSVDVAELRRQVTSKKGTTEAAIEVMHKNKLPNILRNALKAACTRAEELGIDAAVEIKKE